MRKQILLSFVCGAAVGAVAASFALSNAPAAPEPEPRAVEPAPAAPVADAPAAEPAPAAADAVPGPAVSNAPAPVAAEPAAAGAPPAQPAPEAAARPERRGPPRWEDMTEEQREEMRQRFRRMHDENATRVVEAFVERNGLGEDGGERLFAIADAMNERALARVQLWLDYMQLQGIERLPRDRGPQLMRDLFDDLVKGYEDLDAAFGTEWREKDADFDLGMMVDPEVWGSLFRLGGMGPGGFGRGPRGPRGGGNGPRGPGAPAGGAGGAQRPAD